MYAKREAPAVEEEEKQAPVDLKPQYAEPQYAEPIKHDEPLRPAEPPTHVEKPGRRPTVLHDSEDHYIVAVAGEDAEGSSSDAFM